MFAMSVGGKLWGFNYVTLKASFYLIDHQNFNTKTQLYEKNKYNMEKLRQWSKFVLLAGCKNPKPLVFVWKSCNRTLSKNKPKDVLISPTSGSSNQGVLFGGVRHPASAFPVI